MFYLKKNYIVYQLVLKGKELSDGETGVIADKEVLQRIFDADFQNHGLDLVNPKSHIHFYHKFVKTPRDGLYLINVFNPSDRSSTEVLIDTRIFPNFVSVEDNPNNRKATREVFQIMDYSLSLAVATFKWEAVLKKVRLVRVQYQDEFWSAMVYADNIIYPPFFQKILVENNFHGDIDNFNNYQNQL